MTREEADRLVIAAARKVVSTERENYAHEGTYRHILEKRLDRLRRAVRDFDRAVEEGAKEDG